MPKIGIYVLPDFDLITAESRLNNAKDLIPKGVRNFKREIFSEYLGFKKVVSSSHHIASLKSYGFIETGSEEITLTELGELVLYGDELERRNAERRAIQNIRLINDLQSKYGKEPTEAQIRAFLKENANVALQDLQNAIQQVSKFLNNHNRYLNSDEMKSSLNSETLTGNAVANEKQSNSVISEHEWEDISFKNIRISWKSGEFEDAKTLEDALSKLLDLWFQLNKPSQKTDKTKETSLP